MKNLILIALVAMTLTTMAENYSAQYVVQHDETSRYIITYSERDSRWEVYTIVNEWLCPVNCPPDQLQYNKVDRALCMQWAYDQLGYPADYSRYWGDHYGDGLLFVINNYSYGYVNKFAQNDWWCPDWCPPYKRLNWNNDATSSISIHYNNYAIHSNISADEKLSLSIYDCTGRIIYSLPAVSDNNNIIIAPKLEQGIYFINLKSANINETVKAFVD